MLEYVFDLVCRQHFFNTAVQIQATKAGPYGAVTATSDVATVTLDVVWLRQNAQELCVALLAVAD